MTLKGSLGRAGRARGTSSAAIANGSVEKDALPGVVAACGSATKGRAKVGGTGANFRSVLVSTASAAGAYPYERAR